MTEPNSDNLNVVEEQMSVDEGENSDSSSSSSDDEEDKKLLSRAEELEKQISSDGYLYAAHEEIVDIYRQIGDLNSMRQSYERFQEKFPLTPKLWLDWLRDEIKLASTPDEKKRVFDLFDKAVEDYLDVGLWVEYAQFSIGATDLNTTRSILNRGLTSAGLHVSQGSLLWDTLRELENAHVSLFQENSEEWKAQVGKLADVFKRQLSVPLLNIENTYTEWQEWSKTVPEELANSKQIEWAYKKSLHLLEIYKPFEDRLLIAEDIELQNIYKEYIKVVKDPSTVLCLYERAVAKLCLIPQLWEDYCLYAFKLGDVADKISKRALRNCPWSENLWIIRLRILEDQKKNDSEVLACFEQGISSASTNLDLWLSFVEYFHRNGKESSKLDKLFYQAQEQVSQEADPTNKLGRLHAKLLAKRGDMVAARKKWNEIISQQRNKGLASVWLEYANFEKQYGDPSHLRTIFKRALAVCKDWPQYIAEEWLMFERESGTLEDVMKCCDKCRTIVKTEVPLPPQENVEPFEKERYQEKNKRRKPGNTSNDNERKRTKFDHSNKFNEGKAAKFDHSNKYNEGKAAKFDRSNKYNEGKAAKFEKNLGEKAATLPVPTKRIEKDPKTTVFVSNLHPSVDEHRLKELFPNAALIEVVQDRNGKSRCFGYVQFLKEEEVMVALARDRVPIDSRPVFISEIKPAKAERKPKFKYSNVPEENKLFVKGLPLDRNIDHVKEIFKPFAPTDVRLGFKRGGIAFVEFQTAAAAQEALKALDQSKIGDHVIEVAISAPPPKKTAEKTPTAPADEPFRNARSRLQLPMVPRSVQAKKVEGSANGSGSAGPPKSNADFRNMLLKK